MNQFDLWYAVTDPRNKSWFLSFYLSETKNDVRQSDCKILESTLFYGKTDKSTWFLAYRYKFKKRKRYFEHFKLVVVKNGIR